MVKETDRTQPPGTRASGLPHDFEILSMGMSPDNLSILASRLEIHADFARQGAQVGAFDEKRLNSTRVKPAVQQGGSYELEDPINHEVYRSPGFGETDDHYSNLRIGDVVKYPGKETLYKVVGRIDKDGKESGLKFAPLENVKSLGKMPFERHVHPVDPDTGEINTGREVALPYEDEAFQVDWSYNENEFHHKGKFFKATDDPVTLERYRRENPTPIEGPDGQTYNIADVCLKLWQQGALKSGYTRLVEIDSTVPNQEPLIFFIRSSLIGNRWTPATYRDGPLGHAPFVTKSGKTIPGNHFRHIYKRSQGGSLGQTIPADEGTFSWNTERIFKDGQWAAPTRGDMVATLTTIRGLKLGHSIPGGLVKAEIAKRRGDNNVIDEPVGVWDACLFVAYDTVARMKRVLGMHGRLKMFLTDGGVEFEAIPAQDRDDYYNNPAELQSLGQQIIGTGTRDELIAAGRKAADEYMAQTKKLLGKFARFVEFDLDRYLQGFKEHVKMTRIEQGGNTYCEIDRSAFDNVQHLYCRAKVNDSWLGRHVLRPGLQKILDNSTQNPPGLSGPEFTAVPVMANPVNLMCRATAYLYNRRKAAIDRGTAIQGKHVRTIEEVFSHGVDHDTYGGKGLEDLSRAAGLSPVTHTLPRLVQAFLHPREAASITRNTGEKVASFVRDAAHPIVGATAGVAAGLGIEALGLISKSMQHTGNIMLGVGAAAGIAIMNAKHQTIESSPLPKVARGALSVARKYAAPIGTGLTIMGLGLVMSPAVEAIALGTAAGALAGLANVQLGASTNYIGPEKEDQTDHSRMFRRLIKISEHPTAFGMKFLGMSAARKMDGLGIQYNVETLDTQSSSRITALSMLGVVGGVLATIASLRSGSGLVNVMGTAAGLSMSVKAGFTMFKKWWGVSSFRDELFETERSYAFNPKKFLIAIEELRQSFQRVGEATAKLLSRNIEKGPFSWLR